VTEHPPEQERAISELCKDLDAVSAALFYEGRKDQSDVVQDAMNALSALASEHQHERAEVERLHADTVRLASEHQHRLDWIAFNAESWHGDDEAKARALAVIYGWARGGTLPRHPAPQREEAR
jgi:hypothetical protein